MQVSIETTSGLERRLTVGVPAERVDQEVDNRLQQAKKNVRLPGFRPGKVPMRVMRQRFGAGVRQEVLGEVMSQSFQDAVMQEKLRPAGQPTIEPRNLEAGQDLEYVATFEVFPEVTLKDVSGFTVEKPAASVTDEDVDNIIDVFRRQQGSWEEVERAAQEGDKVNIDFTGTRDGEPFEGGSGEGTELELGSGRMVPGFEDGITGMSPGEEKRLALTFPEDYQEESLQGAAVEFAVKVNSVSELQLAPLDEKLFAAYGVEGDDEASFRAEVAANMERELRNATQARVKQQVMDSLLEAHDDLEVPQALIAQEVDGMRRQMFQQFGGASAQNLDLKSLLPDEMFAERAGRRVKLGLLLAELISERELKADPERVRGEIEELASTYQEPEEVINWYYGNQEQLQAVESKVLEDQAVEALLEQASVSEAPCSYQEAISLGQQANNI
ncbi:trigger factor [Pseudohaliea rubra]|uniref:Trigger factor n=1 Tax=Pseudohaliea rubra DSM 19751 TaxID=1265313 RepID=A0A095VQG1_9GAMM|nr:trigger factor [Pseudohaliea rubra]KGE03575.1 Cell division trigger factor [Pseudohaliea rubra DSM 19751]